MDFVFSEREDGGIFDNKLGMDYHIPVFGGIAKEPPMHIVHIAVEMAPIAKVIFGPWMNLMLAYILTYVSCKKSLLWLCIIHLFLVEKYSIFCHILHEQDRRALVIYLYSK